jgi:coproporphyrinogen III oxidase-like Fe-S oxidoreductase
MFDFPFIDSVLIKTFRFRTRGFLRMEEADGTVPPRPRGGNCHLYVHIPFCEVLCPFCSFHRVQHCHASAARYFVALRDELYRYYRAGFKFSGAYFGGGTPTIEPEELLATINLVRGLFGVTDISVETNPRDLRPALLAELRAAGVTRLSVGVQSFDDDLLRAMERYEKYGSAAEIAAHLRTAAGLFPTLNVDLIFNQPRQSIASFERDLAIVDSLGVSQVSCYPLMTSPTVLRRMAEAMGVPDTTRLREFYRTILRRLRPAFAPTSAWCFTRGGQGSDEYIVAAEHYVGVGSGAFSYLDGTLYATTFSLPAYAHRIGRGRTGIVTRHRLSAGDQMRYGLLVRMFGLGLDRAAAAEHYGPKFFRTVWPELAALTLAGAVKTTDRGWQLTERGMYFLMLMMSEFFESVNGYRDAMRAHVQAENAAMAPVGPAVAVAAPG